MVWVAWPGLGRPGNDVVQALGCLGNDAFLPRLKARVDSRTCTVGERSAVTVLGRVITFQGGWQDTPQRFNRRAYLQNPKG